MSGDLLHSVSFVPTGRGKGNFSLSVSLDELRSAPIPQVAQGQVLTVKVFALLHDQALLDFNGTTLLADTRVPMKAGDTLQLQVSGIEGNPSRGGKIYLQLLSTTPAKETPTFEEAIQKLLTSLQISSSPSARELVKGFIEHALPLEPEALKDAVKFLETAPSPEENLLPVIFAAKHHLPLSLPVLGRIKEALTLSPAPLERSVQQLLKLPVLLDNLTGPGQPPGQSSQLQSLTSQIRQLLQNFQSAPFSSDLVKWFTQQAALSQERILLDLDQTQGEIQALLSGKNLPEGPEKLRALLSLLEQEAPLSEKIPPLFTMIAEILQDSDRASEARLPGTPPGSLSDSRAEAASGHQSREDLAPLLSRLREILDQFQSSLKDRLDSLQRAVEKMDWTAVQKEAGRGGASVQAQQAQSAETLKEALSTVAGSLQRSLEAQQIMNLALSRDPQSPLVVIPLPPFREGGGWTTLTIQFQSGKKKEIDPKRCTLTFYASPPHLGQMKIQLSIQPSGIKGGITVTEGKIKEFLETRTGNLIRHLEALNLPVKELAVQVGEVKAPQLMEREVPYRHLNLIDLKA